jgi:hypothetical protein
MSDNSRVYPPLLLREWRAGGQLRCQTVDRIVKTQEAVQCGLENGHKGPHTYTDFFGDLHASDAPGYPPGVSKP